MSTASLRFAARVQVEEMQSRLGLKRAVHVARLLDKDYLIELPRELRARDVAEVTATLPRRALRACERACERAWVSASRSLGNALLSRCARMCEASEQDIGAVRQAR